MLLACREDKPYLSNKDASKASEAAIRSEIGYFPKVKYFKRCITCHFKGSMKKTVNINKWKWHTFKGSVTDQQENFVL